MKQKRLIVVSLLAFLTFSLIGCKETSSSQQVSNSESTSSTQTTSSEQSSEVVTDLYAVTEVLITNKETIADSLYIDDTLSLTFSVAVTKNGEPHSMTVAEAFAADLITVSSSDERVLSVKSSGIVTGLAYGEAVVTLASAESPAIKDSVTLTVYSRDVIVTSASIMNAEAIFLPNLAVGEVHTLELEIEAKRGANEVVMTDSEALSDGLITLTSSNTAVLSVAGSKIEALNEGSAVLKVVRNDSTVLAEQAVDVVEREIDALTLILSGDTAKKRVRQGDYIDLPTVRAYDKAGNEVTSEVTVTSSLGQEIEFNGSIFSSNIVGTHVITYSLKIGEDVATKTVEREVYQRILGDSGATHSIHVYEEDGANPYVRSDDEGNGIRDFYFELSKQYYVEFEWSPITNAGRDDKGHILAGGHFSGDDIAPTDHSPLMYVGYLVKGNDYELAHSKAIYDWDLYWGSRMWTSKNLVDAKDLKGLDPRNQAWKMAVARDGDAFYFFVEDKLINVEYNEVFADIDTKPGLVMVAPGGSGGPAPDVTASKFVKLEGAAVTAKVASLVGASTFSYYTLYDDSKTNDYAIFTENGFQYKEKLATDNYGSMNGTMVTPNILHSGNFEISFDVEGGLRGDNDSWGKLMVDLRTFHDKKTVFLLDMASYRDDYNEFLLKWSEIGGANTDNLAGAASEALGGMPAKAKYNFNLKREYVANNVEKYYISIYNYADPSLVYTYEHEITYTRDQYVFSGPRFIVFHSEKWSGEISHYTVK